MLIANPEIKQNIELFSQNESEVVFKSELLKLRIYAVSEDILRITFTQKDKFVEDLDLGIDGELSSTKINLSENEKEFIVSTKKAFMTVSRKNARIICKDENGKVVFSEQERKPHELEAFDYHKIMPAGEIEYIDTPDGKKPIIDNVKKVFDKVMYKAKLNFSLLDDEKIYGLGQHTQGYFNLRNTTRYLHQANMKVVMPLMLSSNNYGILFNIYGPMIYEDDINGTSLFAESVNEFDFFLMLGDYKKVIKSYRQITGKATLLPMWAYGFVQSQERYETSEEIMGVAKQYREKGLGLDCMVLDWMSWVPDCWGQKSFDQSRFPDTAKFIENLHDINTKFMLSVWPNMRNCKDGDEFIEAGLNQENGNVYDATKPEARAMFGRQLTTGLTCIGIDAYWNDSTEPLTFEWGRPIEPTPQRQYDMYLNGIQPYMPWEISNAYALYHSKTIYDSVREYDDSKRVVNLTRSGYTGAQRYGTIIWSGDTAARWDILKKQVTEGLSFVASGHPWWTLDIGAFFVKPSDKWFWSGQYENGNQDLGYRELFTRWYSYGAFLPMFRSHGTDTRRELWLFENADIPFYDTLKKYNALRYKLMPTLYSIAGLVWKNDDNFIKPLYFCFDDEKVANIGSQFMVGNDIMVCPVTKPMYYGPNSEKLEGIEKTVEVYFPKGYDWYDIETNEVYEGGKTYTVYAGIDKIPVYVKSGAIVLTGTAKNYAEEWLNDEVTVNVYEGEYGEFEWYLDAGDGYGYEKSEYSIVNFKNENGNLSISDVQGSYPNMPKTRNLKIIQIAKDGTKTTSTQILG